MRYAVVKMSDLTRENRWDAGFHLALVKFKDRIAALQSSISAEEAMKRLSKVPLA